MTPAVVATRRLADPAVSSRRNANLPKANDVRIRARRIALCTHGDVMEDVLEHLADAGVEIDGGLRLAKGAYWIFDLDDDGGVSRAAYHRAPRADWVIASPRSRR